MTTVLCYGDSNLRGFVPGSFNEKTGLSLRFPKNKRWTGILQMKLGDSFNVIEEGINGRTTILDEILPGRPYRNGLTQLPVCLETHYPIDLIIFWLGTNDTKLQYNKTALEITEGMRQLIKIVKASDKGIDGKAPKILLISPQPILNISNLHPEFVGNPIDKSKSLAEHYQQLANEEHCAFLDASQVVVSSQLDGVHIDESQLTFLAEVIADKIGQVL